jgi:hypothetical protein
MKDPDIDTHPSLVGIVTVVVCTECKLVQNYTDVIQNNFCTSAKVSKGWQKCPSKTFWRITDI